MIQNIKSFADGKGPNGLTITVCDRANMEKVLELANRIKTDNLTSGNFREILDLEFFASLISLNMKFIESEEKLNSKQLENIIELPHASTYTFTYSIDERINRTVNYKDNWSSYDKDWVADSAFQAYSDGNWDFYSGEETTTDIYDSEVLNGPDIHHVYLLRENIDKLDKSILQELKKLIDEKLNN